MTREIEGRLHAAVRRGHLRSTSGLSQHPSSGQGSCHLMGVSGEKRLKKECLPIKMLGRFSARPGTFKLHLGQKDNMVESQGTY